jgi:hypothetical protein
MTVSDAELRLILGTADEFLNDLEEFFSLCQLHSQNLFQSTGNERVRRIAKIRLKVAGPGAGRQALEPCCTSPLAA